MFQKQIPDFVFNDILNNALVKDKRGFMKLSASKYRLYCKNETKQWVEQSSFDSKFIAFFVRQNKHEIIIPDCIHCGKQLTPKDVLLGHIFCSHFCQTQSDHRREASKQTSLRKYGVENPSQSKTVLAKRKQTCKDRYGADSVVQSDYFKEKASKTLMENYGVDSPFQSELIRQRAKQRCVERFGADNVFKLDYYQQYATNRRRQIYGADYYSQTAKYKKFIKDFYVSKTTEYWSDVANKRKDTNLQRYGCEFTSSIPEVKQQIKNTNILRYGAETYLISSQGIKERKLRQYDKFVSDLRAKSIELLTVKNNIINTHDDITLKCLVCGTEWSMPQTLCSQLCTCPQCYHELGSREEKQFVDLIKTLIDNEKIIENDRTVLEGKELDVYIPTLKLAFEFNGNYWHSDAFDRIDKNYHLAKTQLCAQKGIRLVHIFEYQWFNKRKQIEYFLESLLCSKPTIVYARKCNVIELTNDQFNDFINQYHLQGSVNCSTRLGLVFNNRIVAVAGFTKSRFVKNEIELVRYCTLPKYRIVGGLQKILKHTTFNSVISYVDYSHFDGSGFINAGFEILSYSTPNYVWINNNRVYTRYQTQKHMLKKILQNNYDPAKSETDNMRDANYVRVFDCGNIKLRWVRS